MDDSKPQQQAEGNSNGHALKMDLTGLIGYDAILKSGGPRMRIDGVTPEQELVCSWWTLDSEHQTATLSMAAVHIRPSPLSDVVEADLERRFTYHPVKTGNTMDTDQPTRYSHLRRMGRELARNIVGNTPASREQSLALTKLEEAIFWANAAIARNE